MKYQIEGANVTLELGPEEIEQIITSLVLTDPEGELLAAFRQYRKEEFA
jgi:hypothetical protein